MTAAAAVDGARGSLGLGYLSRDGLQSRVVVNGGPDGGAGLIFALSNVDRLGYYPESQRWERRPDGAVWLGWRRSFRPTTLTGGGIPNWPGWRCWQHARTPTSFGTARAHR